MTAPPLVTVIIPARNEEADIAGCIDAVGTQDHPADRIQLVVVDAASDDGTVAEVETAAGRYPFADVVVDHNPRRRTSVGLNVGLEHAKGDFVARIDARSRVPSGYITTCLDVLRGDYRVGVVGGAQVAIPRSARAVDVGIARALRNRWATGLSRYRRATASGPSDTVWMGFFRTADLRARGGWAPEVALNEDYELNERYRNQGLLVWFDPSLRSGYLPRNNVRLLARQYFYFGRVKGLWWARGNRPALRQLALLATPLIGAGAVLHAVRRFGPGALLTIPVAMAAVEFGGADEHAGMTEHAASAASIGILTTAWWVGTIVGFAGELLGVRHEHG